MKKTFIGVLCILLLSSLCVAVAGCGGKKPGGGTSDSSSTSGTGYSKGLNFSIDKEGKTCGVSGIGECTDTDIIIPSTLPDGCVVTGIGDGAFNDCTEIKSVVIPDSVISIGKYAFSGCDNLKYNEYDNGLYLGNEKNPYYALITAKSTDINNCSINENCKIIADYAFEQCFELASIVISDNVNFIGNGAFYDCSGLTSITIPDSVTSIGSYAFWNCGGLETITVGAGNTKYHSAGNCLIETERKTLILGCNNSVIPSDGSVTSIGYEAFRGCAGLTNIVIPDGVELIEDGTFAYCSGLRSIIIPDSVVQIRKSAFSGCSALTSIVIPDSVTSIGHEAFRDCSGLTSITISDNVIAIDDVAFSGCSGLETIAVGADNTRYHSDGNCLIETESKTLILGCKNSVIPSDGSVTSIFFEAFRDCVGLTSIAIPDSVTSINKDAFSGCDNLEKIYITDFDAWYNISGLKYLMGCGSNNKQLYLNNELLTEVTIPDNVTVIDDSVFNGWCGLSSIVIPDGVTSIGYEAFLGCSSLTSITIPDSVTSIGVAAFYGCSGLTSIAIPDSVTSIGRMAFYNCSGLERITVDPDNTKYSSAGNCLIETESKTLILGCKNSVIPSDGSVANIDGEAFYGCRGLTRITIPYSVTSIGYATFRGCNDIETITVDPDNTKYHSAGNCLIETESKTLILGCNNSVIPSDGSVTNIGGYAFEGRSGLTSIVIPDSVVCVGYGAFLDCSGLETVYYTGTEEQWNYIMNYGENGNLTDATRYYYSETEPALNADGTAYDGNFWHYDSDGKTPVIWKKQ